MRYKTLDNGFLNHVQRFVLIYLYLRRFPSVSQKTCLQPKLFGG